VEPTARRLRVEHAGVVVAETTHGLRVLETSQAPAYYFPPDDVDESLLVPLRRRVTCEWKGVARYLDVVVGRPGAHAAAWRYDDPTPPYAAIAGHVAFYPQRVDVCLVDDERVASNGGEFYGGWVTSELVGPFKGGPGSSGW
jgi:uncharacterized protein (DUF427 family)